MPCFLFTVESPDGAKLRNFYLYLIKALENDFWCFFYLIWHHSFPTKTFLPRIQPILLSCNRINYCEQKTEVLLLLHYLKIMQIFQLKYIN